MKVNSFFLDIANTTIIDGVSVSDRIRLAGKQHLWSDREGSALDTVVIHYASARAINPRRAFDMYLIMKIFCDLGVSSHYIITRMGKIFYLVPENKKAWHCGGSIMPEPDNRQGVNNFSIGIELIATEESGFTKKQYSSLGWLCKDMENRWQKSFRYIGHEDIAGERAVVRGLRNDYKTDPGNKFDWNTFKNSL